MRIISKFRDYYDSVQAHGADPNLVYRRSTSEVMTSAESFPSAYFESMHAARPYSWLWRTNLSFVCFCGRSYPLIEFEGRPLKSGEELLVAMKEQHRLYPDVPQYKRSIEALERAGRKSRVPNFKILTSYLESARGGPLTPDLFRHFGAPVVYVQRIGKWLRNEYFVTANPRLMDLDFVRFVEPFTAYQEIAMYLGNELAQPDIAPQTVGSDKDLAKVKGFDDQSFRTAAPGQKKLNRRANRARKKLR